MPHVPAHHATPEEASAPPLRLIHDAVEGMDEPLLVYRVAAAGEEPRIEYANAACRRLSGYSLEELRGQPAGLLVHPDTPSGSIAAIVAVLQSGQHTQVDLHIVSRDGRGHWVEASMAPLRDASGVITHWVSVQRDITYRKYLEQLQFVTRNELERHIQERTEALHALNQQLEHDALHDALTGLPNRTLFNARLQEAIDGRAEGGAPFAVLFLDCDRFKIINDTLGHTVGDQLLIACAARLRQVVGPNQTVARLGGDEFTVLLEGYPDRGAILNVAERLQRAFSTAFHVGAHRLHIGASIGVITSTDGYEHAGDVMRDADIAMYKAKSEGRGRFVQFNEAMREKTMRQMQVESELRHALMHDQLSVHYQPIVRLDTGQLHGFEALVRWQHPDKGIIAPAEFIALAEETGLIIELDRWVMFEACRQMRQWQRSVPAARDLALAVNMSVQQFTRRDFLETVELVLHASDFPAHRLRLEITEGLVMERSEQVMNNLAGLRALGAQLYVDDFGTGYSSLSYLQQFAPDALKIDRSFVLGMLESTPNAEIVRAVISMAHSLGLSVVAEGVENDEQLGMLRSQGCEYAQGYLFARPLDLAGVSALLRERLS